MDDHAKSIETIFTEVVHLPDAGERNQYLAQACGDDARLRARVEALLKAHDEVGSFMANTLDAASTPTIDNDSPKVDSDGIPIAGPRYAQTDSLSEKPGSMVGRYKLLQQIGEGGFGVVYMAEQEKPVKRRVALKVIKAGMDTKGVIARFEAERQALAMMDHPNIARVLDAGATDNGRPYFVMELVKGIPITDYCDQANLDTPNRLELFKDVCSAVQHAHQKGVIHRDLKPSNIMVTLHDGKPVVKVIDFGIAKATDQKLTEKTLFTNYGQMIGTPAYMSPEQAVMSGLDVDTRSDVYSLGVLLYELLTGGPPFDAKTLLTAGYDEMRRIIREQEPPKPSTRLDTLAADAKLTIAARRHVSPAALSKQLHGDLDWIVMKALEKDRARRYESASAFAQDIERHLAAEPVDAAAPSTGYRLRKFAKRNKGPMTVAATIALLLLVGTVVSTWQAIRASRAETVARNAAQRAEDEAQRARDEAQRATTAEQLAKDRLAEVAAERDAKEAARKDEAAIANFLTEVFQSPDPTRDGRTITVAETLDKAAKKLETDLAAQPGQRARLQETLGQTYSSLGLHQQGIPLEEKARDYYRATFGPENDNTLGTMHSLAHSYRDIGRNEEALKILEEILPIKRRVNGPEHPHTIHLLNCLGICYNIAGRRDEALKLQEEVLALSRKLSGPEDAGTLGAMTNLAVTYGKAGRLPEAVALQEQALALKRRVLPPNHPFIVAAIGNMANVYKKAGRTDEAFKLRDELLALMRKVYGPEHPETLGTMTDTAVFYGDAGRLPEAVALQEQALALKRHLLPPDHRYLGVALENLAELYEKTGRKDEAIKLREELLAFRQKNSGPEHPDTLGAMTDLSNSYDAAGRKDEALKMQEEVLALRRKVSGPEHPDTITAMNNLANSYRNAKLPEKALGMMQELLPLRQKESGPSALETIHAMQLLSFCYYDAGSRDEAFKMGEEVLALRRKVNGPEHPDTLASIEWVARLHKEAGRKDEAAKLRAELEALKAKK